MTSGEIFDRACKALWGDLYVAPAAVSLKVDKNTVGKWRDGKSRVPFGIWNEIAALLEDRERDIPGIKYDVLRIAASLAPYEQEIVISRQELRSFNDANIENPLFLTTLQLQFDAFAERSLHGNRAVIVPKADGFAIRLQNPVDIGLQEALKAWVRNEVSVICDQFEPNPGFQTSVRT